MDERFRTLERTRGVFLRREALKLGYDDNMIMRALRLKIWKRVRHGAYCFFDTWESATDLEQHLIRARAELCVQPGAVALSHTTSMIAHGIAVWDVDLSLIHLTRLDGGPSRRTPTAIHHRGRLREEDLTESDGVLLTRPARAVLESSTVLSLESSLVSTDAALHMRLVDLDELMRGHRALVDWPGAQRLQLVLRLADGRSESPGETRSRLLFWTQNLPRPELQFEVYDESGVLVGVTDFAWPGHGLLGEFDGKQKYGRLLRPGQDPGDAVFAEKRREDRLREITGWSMIRLVWADLYAPSRTGARIARMLRGAA
jgi:hypothetical protein